MHNCSQLPGPVGGVTMPHIYIYIYTYIYIYILFIATFTSMNSFDLTDWRWSFRMHKAFSQHSAWLCILYHFKAIRNVVLTYYHTLSAPLVIKHSSIKRSGKSNQVVHHIKLKVCSTTPLCWEAEIIYHSALSKRLWTFTAQVSKFSWSVSLVTDPHQCLTHAAHEFCTGWVKNAADKASGWCFQCRGAFSMTTVMYESSASDNTKCAMDFQIVTNIILNGEQRHGELHQTSEQSKIGGWVIAQNCAVYAVWSEIKKKNPLYAAVSWKAT